ncbi:ABC transporter substrate-binding protein [Georgenia subflava]|uniref:Extracellular solute-binding protein n=1 Tax=Georgenia subflava TaxID=1622177 RepID=A0A6N7EN49_9MICO|nr:sugar ABC transporter substrate-binding protein [Georgenia subflava]MPV38871.1 extracellular solute-binding protein [Georgenia subflava]
MRSASRRRTLLGGAGAAVALALAACSPGAQDVEAGSSGATDASGMTTVTFRLWDEVAAPAYEESFDAFAAAHPDIRVEVEVVPWAEYWERLPQDVSAGEMSDIYWTNTSTFGPYAESGDLIDVSDALGDEHDEWEESVVDLFTRDGSLWGVPQLWESVALYYNKSLVEEAGVDPTELVWAPPAEDSDAPVGEADTLLAAARALTTDAAGVHAGADGFDAGAIQTFGINAQGDPQAVYVPFLAQNGARFLKGGELAFATPEGAAAFQYLVDLVRVHRVAPSAAAPDADGDPARDLFLQGRLGLFLSGPDDLRTISDDAQLEWGVAPMVAGPEGRIGVVNGVAAVGNAHTEHEDATVEVLRWLGSADGQAALASQGVGFPGVVDAQGTFVEYWAERDVDVEAFVDAAQEPVVPAPVGPDVEAAIDALAPVLHEMFRGAVPVPEALEQAQKAGNEALRE